MKIAIPKEIYSIETRVAATPETVKRLKKEGFEVLVQTGAGESSFISDDQFKQAGANLIGDVKELYAQADLVLKIQRPMEGKGYHEVDLLKQGSILISFLQPLIFQDLFPKLNQRRIQAIASDMIPRIARAQKLDVLSSQSNLAGYKAVMMGANAIGKMMPMMMTAAGTVTPARVFVIGAGVAGLQAIATAKRLGAVVEAYDTRPVVKEQVESLGGKFLMLEMPNEEAEDKRGYAKEQSEEAKRKGAELIAKAVEGADIVITTALIPGRPSPKLISEAMVKKMRNGSAIIDLAADGGGNCEITEVDKTVIKHGVSIIGQRNIPGLMPGQASQLYARNLLNYILDISKEGKVTLDMSNEVVKGSLITQNGEVIHEMTQNAMQKGSAR